MPGAKLAGGDTMNLWIATARDELLETIREWDFLLINDGEAAQLSGDRNLRRAAAKILGMGPRTLVIKRGEYGAVLFQGDDHFMAPGYLLENVFDPTGAGDCFAGGFIGYLAGRGVERQCRPSGFRRAAPRGDLRLGDGQLLLRAVRRGSLPHPDPRRDRSPLPGVPKLDGVLTSRPRSLAGIRRMSARMPTWQRETPLHDVRHSRLFNLSGRP